jgi:hypothetical protein
MALPLGNGAAWRNMDMAQGQVGRHDAVDHFDTRMKAMIVRWVTSH